MRHPPIWDGCTAWQDYAYPWSRLITRWKFAQQPGLAQHLARWMRSNPEVAQTLAWAEVVVPVPLSRERMRERGYNPAAQLAQALSPTHCQLHTLVRTTHTPAQSALSRRQRLRNLRQAFTVHADLQPLILQRRVLLIDDVMTTGATAHSASHALLQAGAQSIRILCAARTP